jgi:hypothetical protein
MSIFRSKRNVSKDHIIEEQTLAILDKIDNCYDLWTLIKLEKETDQLKANNPDSEYAGWCADNLYVRLHIRMNYITVRAKAMN